MNSPQQAIFSALYKEISEIYPCYKDTLPPEGTEYPFDYQYPFVYLGGTTLTPSFSTKYHPLGNVSCNIDVWHDNPQKRGTVSEMLYQIEKICYELNVVGYKISVREIVENIRNDDSSATPLLRGSVAVTFDLQGGKHD
jgi:hypothetical protein